MPTAPADLASFAKLLRREGELVEVAVEVDPALEAAEIHRRVIAAGGPALLFRRVKGSPFPLITNLFGSRRRIELAFGPRPEEVISGAVRLVQERMPPSLRDLWARRGLLASLARVGLRSPRSGAVSEVVQSPPRLLSLPAIQSWPRDGGRFVTLPLVYTEHPVTGSSNLGMYRLQLQAEDRTGLHVQIQRGCGFHLAEAEARGQALPVNVFVGGPPAAMLGAIAPLPENVPELLLASLALGRRLPLARNPFGPLPLLADADFALVGEAPAGVREPEGPFGDHYGYYSETHDFPVFRCRALLHRRDAIWPATVVGKPRQEDFFLGDYLQELLSPLFPLVMPGVRDLWSYGETGYHSLSAAVVRERYEREAMASAFRILGEGQLSLTKFLLVVDGPVDLRDFRATLVHALERTDFRTDLYVFPNLAMDTLDYAGPRLNRGSKGVLLALGEARRELPEAFEGEVPAGIRAVRPFCPGALVVEGPAFEAEPEAAARVAAAEAFADWPLIALTDDAERCARSPMNFLWSVFTRFDPAADLHGARVELHHNHASFHPPVCIDARMKPGYPEELSCDEKTAERVSHRWREYFPGGGVEMGDSDRGHLD